MHWSKSSHEWIRRGARVLAAGALAGMLAACGLLAPPGALGVRGAQLYPGVTGAVLELGLDCRLSGPMQDALDHGIPITFAIDVRAGDWPHVQARATRAIELRYYPLSRRYQLRVGDSDDVRSFATQAYLVSALGSLRMGLPEAFARLAPDTPLHVRAAIDPTALPGALRLPALFEPAWRLASADSTWPAATR
ncbi:DUF4390 domain-containing protein [Dokdonella fugitiva]|jgi:hypothetical protein|uniref:Uncharacterized protein DUF4390 n=1 Tax=Dokdonella fugitiva TaxID=328517 RepID=A0A4R2IHT4_9GAMM|nr:DUF4390 domain-containing protein [Dokdonella fugitiva]TCO43328.1 uncharacterized protein DUF4390 [Dokdonella fugitiva]